MPDPKLWRMLLPCPALEGSNKCGKENNSFLEQETEAAETSLEAEAMPVCAAACFLSEHLLLLK